MDWIYFMFNVVDYLWYCWNSFMPLWEVWLQNTMALRPFKTLVLGGAWARFNTPPDASLDAQEEKHHTSIATSLNMTIHLVFWRVFCRVYVPVVVLRVIMLDGWTNEVQFGFLPVTGAQRWVSLHGNFVSVCPSYKVHFPWFRAVKHDTIRLSRLKAL